MEPLPRFSDVSGLMQAFQAKGCSGPNHAGLRPGQVPDHERKYLINEGGEFKLPIYTSRLEFQHLIHTLSKGENPAFEVRTSEIFAGIDEGFEFEDPENEGDILTLRLRFGSNRSCKLTTKVRSRNGDNTERTRSSISISYQDLASTRTMLILISQRIPYSRHLLVGQSGEFWFVDDPSGYMVEIALYKVGRAEPDATSPLKLVAEIAPWGCPNVTVAVEIIERYEGLLNLTGTRIEQTNMELFRDKN